MCDCCEIKSMLVDIQENGIIRIAESGKLIARLVDDVKYDDLEIPKPDKV